METTLTPIIGAELALMPVMDIEMALNRREQITTFIKKVMRKNVDYGIIPGTGDRPALLKAGAEKLTTLFGLSKKFTILETAEDWDGKDHEGEPFFHYVYRCHLFRGDLLIAEADGSCNSHESKYRYRKAERLCPTCGQAVIIKGKAEYGGGWICYAKKGGCGAKFRAGDSAIESQEVGRVLNPDVADQANTILKMAQKRALVAATLLAINASEFFSTKEIPGQDEDDQPVEAAFTVTKSEPSNGKTDNNDSSVTNGDIPRKPLDLLELVNRRVEATYDNLHHLLGGIRKHLGDPDWSWPMYKDVDSWQAAYKAAYEHAQAKVSQILPESESTPITEDEIPF